MKFSDYYDELITERRYTDDKFEVITKKMPNWLLDEFGGDPNMVVRMPMYSDFRKYLLDRGEDVTNNEDVILGLDKATPAQTANLPLFFILHLSHFFGFRLMVNYSEKDNVDR